VLAGESDRLNHVVVAGAADDEGGPPVDGGVPDGAGIIVAGIFRQQHGTRQIKIQKALGIRAHRHSPSLTLARCHTKEVAQSTRIVPKNRRTKHEEQVFPNRFRGLSAPRLPFPGFSAVH
jgi:hypothetical protein